MLTFIVVLAGVIFLLFFSLICLMFSLFSQHDVILTDDLDEDDTDDLDEDDSPIFDSFSTSEKKTKKKVKKKSKADLDFEEFERDMDLDDILDDFDEED